MPQVQVIERQEDPTVKALGQAGNDIADTLYKTQSLKLTGEYYKILGKNAENETKKFEFERKAKTMDMLTKIAETQDQATKAMLVKALIEGPYQGDAKTAFSDIADSHKDIQQQYMSMKPEEGTVTEGQLRGAQAYNQRAAGEKDLAEAAYYRNPGMGIPGMDPNLPAAGEGVGGYLPGNITRRTPTGTMDFVNPATKQNEARATAIGSAQGKTENEKQLVSAPLATYMTTLDAAIKETGGPSATTAAATIKSGVGLLKAPFTKDSAVAALEPQIKPLGLSLGSYMNQGRPTEPDAKTGEMMLPRVQYAKATNNILKKRLRDLFNIKLTGNQERDAQLLNSFGQQSAAIASVDQKFTNALRAQGKTLVEINKLLDEIHKQRGY